MDHPHEEEEEPLLVNIPLTGVDRDHVTYTVTISKGSIEWTLTKRFSSFQKLHKKLQSQVKGELPKIPPKKIKMGKAKFNEDFVEERRGHLMRYLLQVLSIASPENVEALDDFLEYSENYLLGSLRRLEHIPEVQDAVVQLQRASAGAGHLVVEGRADRHNSFASEGTESTGGDSDDEFKASADGSTATPLKKLTLGDALQGMVQTLDKLLESFTSEAQDHDEAIKAQTASIAGLNKMFSNHQDQLAEGERLFEKQKERDAEAVKAAAEQEEQITMVNQTLEAEIREVKQRIDEMDRELHANQRQFKAIRRELRVINGLSVEEEAPKLPIARARDPERMVTMANETIAAAIGTPATTLSVEVPVGPTEEEEQELLVDQMQELQGEQADLLTQLASAAAGDTPPDLMNTATALAKTVVGLKARGTGDAQQLIEQCIKLLHHNSALSLQLAKLHSSGKASLKSPTRRRLQLDSPRR